MDDSQDDPVNEDVADQTDKESLTYLIHWPWARS